ncbi:DUF4403 family protein [Rufibacter soli]
MPKRFFLYFLPALIGLSGCQRTSSLAENAPAPAIDEYTAPPLQLSTITLPVTVPVRVLEERLNQEMNGVLYQDNNLQDDNLEVKVTKAGPIKLTAAFSKLTMEVPLKIWARGRWQWNACTLCKRIQKTEETEFDVTVRTDSRLQVLPDYTLKSYTSGDFVWGARKPTVSFGPLRINLAPFVEPKLKAQMAPLLAQLDQQLQERIPLQTFLNQTWQQIQNPLLLNKQYQAWLSISPQAIRVTPLELQQDQLSLQVGIDAFVHVATGKKPEAKALSGLPRFTPVRTLPQEAQIALASEVPYASLTQMVQQGLKGQTFTFEDGKHQLTIHQAQVSGTGTKLLLALETSGQTKAAFLTKKFSGKIYLQGVPYYDPSTQSIKVRQLNYTLDTQDQLLNTAQWLLKNRLLAQLEQNLDFPVKSQLTTLRQALQAGLAENRLQEQVLLRGSGFTLEPDTLFVTPTGIRAHFQATGKLALFVE